MSKPNSNLPASLGAVMPSIDDHEKDRARRYEASKANQRRLLDCLDPTVAKSYEDRKELFEWRVEVKLFRPAVGRNAAHMEEFDKKVVAQNEQDAWAMFCDLVGEWPSPRDSHPTITKLKRRTLRADADTE